MIKGRNKKITVKLERANNEVGDNLNELTQKLNKLKLQIIDDDTNDQRIINPYMYRSPKKETNDKDMELELPVINKDEHFDTQEDKDKDIILTDLRLITEEVESNKNAKDIMKSKCMKLFTAPTHRDYEDMTYDELLVHDKRTFCQYYYHTLKSDHMIISIFSKSLINPYFIKISTLLFSIVLESALNAVFFSDDYISKRKHTTTQTTSIFYTIFNELPKSIWSVLISNVITSLAELIAMPRMKYEHELMEELKTLDESKIKSA